LLFFQILPVVMAHAPLGSRDNESIDKATVIPDPTKSWALYSQLNSDGDAQYYTFIITSGQKIHVTLYKSMRTEDTTFIPRLAIIGPNIVPQGILPSKITVQSGLGVNLVTQIQPKPTYEPFSPSIYIVLADVMLENPALGKYYLVVYEQSDDPKGGNYGLGVGDRETYTIDEWLLIPFNLITIYQWEGQSLALILTPIIVTLFVGIVFIAWSLKKQNGIVNPMAWFGAIGSITFMGTAFTTLFELLASATKVTVGREAVITLIISIIPLALGFAVLRLSIKNSRQTSIRKRVYYIIMGIVALFMWAGS